MDAFDHIATEDLGPCPDAHSASQGLVDELASKDWQVALTALTVLRQLAKHQPELLHGKMDAIPQAVLKSVKSPRSTLSKAGLMATRDLFTFCGPQAVDHLDPLLLQLLLTASSDKKFLSEEAERALAALAQGADPCLVLRHVEPLCAHSNPRVRAKATACYERCASLLTPEQAQEYGLDALLKVAGKQIRDQLPEAREAARKLVQHVHKLFLLQSRVHETPTAATAAAAAVNAAVPAAPSMAPPFSDAAEAAASSSSAAGSPANAASEAAVQGPGEPCHARVNGSNVPSDSDSLPATGSKPNPAVADEEGVSVESAALSPWDAFCKSCLPHVQCTAVAACSQNQER